MILHQQLFVIQFCAYEFVYCGFISVCHEAVPVFLIETEGGLPLELVPRLMLVCNCSSSCERCDGDDDRTGFVIRVYCIGLGKVLVV